MVFPFHNSNPACNYQLPITNYYVDLSFNRTLNIQLEKQPKRWEPYHNLSLESCVQKIGIAAKSEMPKSPKLSSFSAPEGPRAEVKTGPELGLSACLWENLGAGMATPLSRRKIAEGWSLIRRETESRLFEDRITLQSSLSVVI